MFVAGLQFDVDNLRTLISRIFRQVLPNVGKPQEFASLRADVFNLSVGISKFELGIRQENHDAGRVLVHDGFLTSSVADSNHSHPVVLQFDFVVFRNMRI